MVNLSEKLENVLKFLLQKHIVLVFNNKKYKEGRLILFKYNTFHLKLTLKNENNNKNLEIPIPYNIIRDNDDIVFDYRINTLSRNNKEIYDICSTLTKLGNNKYYDSKLYIKVKNNE
jgi:S-adenosylmethionine:tRNA-ribosyltransferase-isomerase (queuine synthetase)